MLVTHEQGGFSTSLYRKKTFTGLYTDYASVAPDKYKINLVRILVFRAFHICSSYISFHYELMRIKRILTENCFPRSIIDRVIVTQSCQNNLKKIFHITFFLPDNACKIHSKKPLATVFPGPPSPRTMFVRGTDHQICRKSLWARLRVGQKCAIAH